MLVISLTVSGLAVGASYYFQQQRLGEFMRFDSQLHTISQRYLSIEEEEQLIKQYLPRFIALHNEGVLGGERRLRWIEVLNDAGQRLKLPGLSYEIASQQQDQPGYPLIMGQYRLFSSVMTLTMTLLHEGDLFRLFELLESTAPGLFTVSTCELNRHAGALSEDADKGTISANCELIWYSIKLANGDEIAL